MRIIHTSDWHLGHVLYGYDRSREQRDMLGQIEEIVGKEKPDALVVSGDVYHTGQPSAAVQKMRSISRRLSMWGLQGWQTTGRGVRKPCAALYSCCRNTEI